MIGRFKKYTALHPVLLQSVTVMSVMLIALTLLMEVFVWNLTSIQSLFYHEIDLQDKMNVTGEIAYLEDHDAYLLQEGGLAVEIRGIQETLHNIHIQVLSDGKSEGNGTISYTISLTDEGHYYAYDLPEKKIVFDVKETEYTNIYSYGKVNDLTITFVGAENMAIQSLHIRANVFKPFSFSLLRIAGMYLTLMIGWLLLSGKGLAAPIKNGDKKQAVITVLAAFAVVLCALQLAPMNPVNARPVWPHHSQYHELTEMLLEGRVALWEKPPEELIQADNPYDTIWLQAQGIEYKADYVYYNGNYYIYFGIVPGILLYLPFYLIMGFHLPNYFAVFLLFAGFAVAVFALYREMIRRYFPKTPFLIYLLVSVMSIFVGSYTWMIASPDLYDVPIAAANMFTAAGLWLWIKALHLEKKKGLLLALGSLCMALVAGCRPQMLFYSALAIPLFYKSVIKDRTLFSRKGVSHTIAFCLPYLCVAAGIMYYNAIRFDSPFDFGATYSLTSSDMTKRGMNMERTILGLYHFFLQLPMIRAVFPFIERNYIETIYMGKLTTEYTYGGLLVSNVFLWFTGAIGAVGKSIKDKRMPVLAGAAAGITFVIAVLDINYAGILQRYMTDFTWGLVFAAAIGAFMLSEKLLESNKKILGILFLSAWVLQGLYSFFLTFGGGEGAYSLESMAPEIFYRFASW